MLLKISIKMSKIVLNGNDNIHVSEFVKKYR